MIKIGYRVILAVVCLAIIAFGALFSHGVSKTTNSEALRILVAYNPKYLKQARHILAPYTSVLEEEGIAFQTIGQHQLLAVDPISLVDTVPAVIFPDALCQHMAEGFQAWIEDYVVAGGGIAAIYDPAVKDTRDAYLPSTLFKQFSGINHVTYTRLTGAAYDVGGLRFKDRRAADHCEIPYGKLDPSLFLSGYGYGRLQYPVARNEIIPEDTGHPAPQILAEAVINQSEAYPAVVTRQYGKGHVFYVNMPLGYLKANADDLPMRSLLRFFLFKTIKVPHMMRVPFGKGGIVFNWHHDSNADFAYLERMLNAGFFRKALKYSMHITAGDSMYNPDDGMGFDACGRGKRFVQMLKPYGTIGSHGGMYHNWFANNIASGAFGIEQIKKYVDQNNRCLESVTGERVSEYSAPKGVHPPKLMAAILPEMGIHAYYYTGDNGSAPNRSFFQGRMVSDRMIAFPVMPRMDKASLVEIRRAKTEGAEVHNWLQQTVDYAIENRTVRMLYSHPYDLYNVPKEHKYIEAFLSFLDYLEEAQAADRLEVRPMSYFANFMLQMLKTKCSYTVHPEGIDVQVQKTVGLKGLTIAFPKDKYQPPQGEHINLQITADVYYATLESASHDTRFFVPAR